jgi:hypothetical protein
MLAEFDGSTSDMRRVFVPANDPNYKSEEFSLSPYATTPNCGQDGTFAVSLLYYGTPSAPFVIGKNNLTFLSHRWWLAGPTTTPGYYVILLKENNYDNLCNPKNYIVSNSLVDLNKYVWACLVSKPPLIVPDQVFNVSPGEYCEIPIQLAESRGARIPENVSVAGSTNPLRAEFDTNYRIHGLEFRYNKKPRGADITAQNFLPNDNYTGDMPTLMGYPKVEGKHTFRVTASNMYGATEQTIVVNVRRPGVTISLIDWSANWNTFADTATPHRTVEVFGKKQSSSFEGVSVQVVNTTPTGASFEMTLPIPGTNQPDTSRWSTGSLRIERNELFEASSLVFIRFKAPVNSPSSATEYKATLVARTIEFGLSSSDEQELKSIVFPVNFQAFGNHLFTAVFPVYCNVTTAGQKTINRKYFEDTNTPIGFVSVNGAEPVRITDDYKPTLNAGWNRLVFVYTNDSGPVAPFVVDNIEGVTSWWSPLSMKGCVGKLVKDCIPAVNTSSGLENNLKGLFYYNIGADNALSVEQNAFPYMPVNQSEFPFAVVGEGYRNQNNLREILHYHNDWTAYLDRLKTQALPGYDYLVLSPNRNRIEFYNDIRGGNPPTI